MAKVIHVGIHKIKSDAPEQAVRDLDSKIIAFKEQIPGVLYSYAGPFVYFPYPQEIVETYNISSDVRPMARGYNHGLYVVFADENARWQYDKAQPHLDVAPYLIPLLEGGMDGVLTFDFVLPDSL